MKNIKIYIPKIRKLEYILGLSFIVPYMEIRIVKDLLDYENNGVIIPASIFIMLILSIILTFIMKFSLKQKLFKDLNKLEYVHFILDLFIIVRGLFVEDFFKLFAQLLWFSVPFYYAFTILRCIDHFKLKACNVGKVGIFYFLFYICTITIVNIKQYGFELSGTISQTRLLSPGGGPVILGYTIVIIMCYLLSLRNVMDKKSILIAACVLTFVAILTGSRGSIWPILILLFLLFTTNKMPTNIKILSFILFTFGIVIINPIDILVNLVPRIFNFSGGARSETVIRTLEVFSEQPIYKMLFGTGLSEFFPYQDWLLNSREINFLSYNTFMYNEQILLVQPHNSYIYLLMETGLFGLILYIYIFIKEFIIIKKKCTSNKLFKYLLLISIVFLNYLDSIFIIQPGSSGLWWALQFLIIYDGN